MEPKAVVLVLLFVCVQARAQSACTSGFPTLETVRDMDAGEGLPNILFNVRLWLFPSMNFSCRGNITKWVFQAVASGDEGDSLPQMQVWRENPITPMTVDYELQGTSGSEDEMEKVGESVYEYVPKSPVPVEEGDIFGLALMDERDDRALLLQFQDLGILNAPQSFLTPLTGTFLDTTSGQVANDFQYLPLVTVVVEGSISISPSSTTEETSSVVASSTVLLRSSTNSYSTISTISLQTLQPTVPSESTSSTGIGYEVFVGIATAAVLGFTVSTVGVVLLVVVVRWKRTRHRAELVVEEMKENASYGRVPDAGAKVDVNAAYGVCAAGDDSIRQDINPAYDRTNWRKQQPISFTSMSNPDEDEYDYI